MDDFACKMIENNVVNEASHFKSINKSLYQDAKIAITEDMAKHKIGSSMVAHVAR